MADTVKELPMMQQLFVEAYLAMPKPNATKAALEAGYSPKTAYSQGQRLLKKVEIQQLVSKRVETAVMSANEVLERLSEHARASLTDVLDDRGNFDLEAAKKNGKDHLLKKLKVRHDKDGTSYEYELHDAQSALVHLGKYHKLFEKADPPPGATSAITAEQFAIAFITMGMQMGLAREEAIAELRRTEVKDVTPETKEAAIATVKLLTS